MTTEIMLVALYAFILLGAFFSDFGPMETFKKSTPRLAARIERNISIGYRFQDNNGGGSSSWQAPPGSQ